MCLAHNVSPLLSSSETTSPPYPLSPVASMKLFHLGCSQISSAASAVSVHQHIVLLNSSLSLNRGRNAEMALFIVASEACG